MLVEFAIIQSYTMAHLINNMVNLYTELSPSAQTAYAQVLDHVTIGMLVAGLRGGSFRTKANKDLVQSAALITYAAKHQPEDLMDAWTDLDSRGKAWRTSFEKGVALLLREMPELAPSLIWRTKTMQSV